MLKLFGRNGAKWSKLHLQRCTELLIYVDESGKLDSSDTSVRPTIAAVIIPPSELISAEDGLRRIKERVLPDEVSPDDYEIKAQKILRPSAGGFKTELAELFFSEYLPRLNCSVVAIVCRKPKNIVPLGNHLPLHHQWLIQRVYEHLEQNQRDGVQATFIYDSQEDPADEELARLFREFMTSHPRGRVYASRVAPSPQFVDSAVEPGIQLADMIAGCIRHQAEDQELGHLPRHIQSRINRYHRSVRAKAAEITPGTYAIYYMSQEAMERLERHARSEPLRREAV